MPLPTESEVRTQLQNAVRILRKVKNFLDLDATPLKDLIDTHVQAFEGEYAAEMGASVLELRGRGSDLQAMAARLLSPIILQYNQILTGNKIFIERTADVGVLPADVAVNYGVTGPSLRGSGVKFDLRRHEPYSIYDCFDFDVITAE